MLVHKTYHSGGKAVLLLDDLGQVLHELGRGLRRVAQRLAPLVDGRQRPLERRGRAGRVRETLLEVPAWAAACGLGRVELRVVRGRQHGGGRAAPVGHGGGLRGRREVAVVEEVLVTESLRRRTRKLN